MNDLKGKKVAILTEDGFEEIELTSPSDALKEAGAEVLIVSPKKDKVKAKSGDDWTNDYDVDLQLANAKSTEFDALVIPGGVINPDKLRVNKEAIKFVQAFFNENKPVAAICHGPQVLINAEVVRNKKITSVEAIEVDLKNAGAHWEDKEVIVDGNLITSRTPKDLPAFNKTTIEVIANR